MSSKWVNQIVDCVFGNDKLCCFCPRPESTFWTMTQNASTQNLKFPILLFHINKVGARINQMGHHFNKMGARINKMGHSESTKCGAPTQCQSFVILLVKIHLSYYNMSVDDTKWIYLLMTASTLHTYSLSRNEESQKMCNKIDFSPLFLTFS